MKQASFMRCAVQWLVAASALTLGARVGAQTIVAPVMTPMQSSAQRIISYRHQDHMWQTADGAMHVLVNRGATNGLAMYSSYDSGTSWSTLFQITDGVDVETTSDGQLSGNTLSIAYSTSAGTVAYATSSYNPAASDPTQRWTLDATTETVFSDPTLVGFNPACVTDHGGVVWCAVVAQNPVTLDANIRLFFKEAPGTAWKDSMMIFGQTDHLPDGSANTERSARPVLLSTGVGMVYTVHAGIYWATRVDGTPLYQRWSPTTLFISVANDNDPDGSHFSVVADPSSNVHLAFTDGGQVNYMRFNDSSQHWIPVKGITANPIGAGYLQITSAGSELAVVVNFTSGSAGTHELRVYQSSDGGISWAGVDKLTFPTWTGASVSYPRMETAANLFVPNGPGSYLLGTLMQYDDASRGERLAYYPVQLVQNAGPHLRKR